MIGLMSRSLVAALLVCALPAQPVPALPPPTPDHAQNEPTSLTHEVRFVALSMGVSVDPSGGPLGMLNALAAGSTTAVERARLGAATLFGGVRQQAGPLAAFAFLAAGEQFDCWQLRDTDLVRPLTESARAAVLDRTGVASTVPESQVYWNTIYQAGQTSAAAFRGAARTEWNPRALEKDPASFRGEVLYVEGRLKFVTPFSVRGAGRDIPVSGAYHGTLFDASDRPLAVVHFAELPPGVRADKGAEFRASFAGYFFKLLVGDRGGLVPLLIGRTFQPIAPPEDQLPQTTAALLLSCQAGPGSATAPLAGLALLRTGEYLNYWSLSSPDEGPPALRRDLLLHVPDQGWIPSQGEDDWDEFLAYCDFLKVASRTSTASFAREARNDVTYAQLIRQPSEYRGEVLRFDSSKLRLKRLTHLRAPRMLQLAGITDLYEAWIFDESEGVRPYCVVLTEVPEGLKPGRLMTVRVAFDAYFFKKGDYEADDLAKGQRRVAPLLVGGRLRVLPGPEKEESVGDTLIIAGITFLMASGVAVFAFMLWYRRNDRRILARLRTIRGGEFVLPTPDAVPIAVPVRPAGEGGAPAAPPPSSVRPEHEGGGFAPDAPTRD
jgi:hypothetical protein